MAIPRDPVRAQFQEARRIARLASQTPEDRVRGSLDQGQIRSVGANDPDTGDWRPFGQLDKTTFGEGWRLS